MNPSSRFFFQVFCPSSEPLITEGLPFLQPQLTDEALGNLEAFVDTQLLTERAAVTES